MAASTRALVGFVILFHAAAFVLEAVLWMQPGVYENALPRINAPTALTLHDQAVVLRTLFLNQGAYNLMLAGAGCVGLYLLRRGDAAPGKALLMYMCLTAVGAGVVLACTTRAYAGAVLQALPAAIAIAKLR